jgi:O-methyltransferase
MIDVDLYTPTLAALEFFYPRLVPGGYVFVHDYNSPESEWGVSRAVNLFMRDKPEPVVEIPDKFGTVIFRRCFADSTI